MYAYEAIAADTLRLGHARAMDGQFLVGCSCGWQWPPLPSRGSRRSLLPSHDVILYDPDQFSAHRVTVWAEWAHATGLITMAAAVAIQRLLPDFDGTYEQLLTVANGIAA